MKQKPIKLTRGERKVLEAFRALIADPDEEQLSVSLSDRRTMTLTICGPAETVPADEWDHDDNECRRGE